MLPTTTPVRDLFGIDTRSLAVFRVALAAAIVADLLIRVPDLAAHYTEEGVQPRALLDEQVRARAPALVPILALMPHLLLDGAAGQALLFVVAVPGARAAVSGEPAHRPGGRPRAERPQDPRPELLAVDVATP